LFTPAGSVWAEAQKAVAQAISNTQTRRCSMMKQVAS
jgi:hypothetical protein